MESLDIRAVETEIMHQFTQFHCLICIMLWCKEKALKIQLQRSNHQLIHRVITIDNIIYTLNFNSSICFFRFFFFVFSSHFPIIIENCGT